MAHMFKRCGAAESRRPQGYVMTACLEGMRRQTRLRVVIHHRVIGLQMRAEGGQKRITASFPPGLCFLSHVETARSWLVLCHKPLQRN